MVGGNLVSRLSVASTAVFHALLASRRFEWQYFQFDPHVHDWDYPTGRIGVDMGGAVCQVWQFVRHYFDSLLVEFASLSGQLVRVVTPIVVNAHWATGDHPKNTSNAVPQKVEETLSQTLDWSNMYLVCSALTTVRCAHATLLWHRYFRILPVWPVVLLPLSIVSDLLPIETHRQPV